MHIDIQTKGFTLTKALAAHVQRRLKTALAARDDHIVHAQVRLSDINGPRGGVDKCCQLRVQIAGSTSVVVRDVSADMYAAIDKAAKRVSSSVGRRLGRMRSPKRPGRNPKAQIFNKTSFAA